MTFREILEKVRFEDLVRPLIGIENHTKRCLYGYKQAFDLLMRMEPKENDQEPIDVGIGREEGEPPYLFAWFHVREDWDKMLSRTVVIASDCYLTYEEIAAILLWEITYWGYSPQQEDETFEDKIKDAHVEGNPYVTSYKKLQQRNHDLNCRYAEDIGTNHYSLKGDYDNEFSWEPKRNGPKRHRQRRQEKRLEFLERQMKSWDLWWKLTAKTRLETHRAELLKEQILGSTTSIYHPVLQSRTDQGKEIPYIVDLIRDYFPKQEGSKAIVLISGPQRIMEDEKIGQVWDTLCALDKLPQQRELVLSANEDLEDLCVDFLIFG